MDAKDIKLIHKGEYLSYYEINYEDNDGNKKTYEMVSKTGSIKNGTPELTLNTIGDHTDAVVMVVFNTDHNKILVQKEKRLGINRWIYNNPAGLIDPGETVFEAATRELYEETGLKLTKILKQLKPTFTCAPVTDELASLIICEAEGKITNSNSIFEETESKWCTKDEVAELLEQDEVQFSGRTQAIFYMWVYGGVL